MPRSKKRIIGGASMSCIVKKNSNSTFTVDCNPKGASSIEQPKPLQPRTKTKAKAKAKTKATTKKRLTPQEIADKKQKGQATKEAREKARATAASGEATPLTLFDEPPVVKPLTPPPIVKGPTPPPLTPPPLATNIPKTPDQKKAVKRLQGAKDKVVAQQSAAKKIQAAAKKRKTQKAAAAQKPPPPPPLLPPPLATNIPKTPDQKKAVKRLQGAKDKVVAQQRVTKKSDKPAEKPGAKYTGKKWSVTPPPQVKGMRGAPSTRRVTGPGKGGRKHKKSKKSKKSRKPRKHKYKKSCKH